MRTHLIHSVNSLAAALTCIALLVWGPTSSHASDEADAQLQVKDKSVKKDGTVKNAESKLAGSVSVQGPEDAEIKIHSMSFEPPAGWSFRKFKDEEIQGGALDITGTGADYVDMDTGPPGPQSPVASFTGNPQRVSGSAVFLVNQVDAGSYPLKMDGNLDPDGGGGEGPGEEKHWAAKVKASVPFGRLIVSFIAEGVTVPERPDNLIARYYPDAPDEFNPSDGQLLYDFSVAVNPEAAQAGTGPFAPLITAYVGTDEWEFVPTNTFTVEPENGITAEEREYFTRLLLEHSVDETPPEELSSDLNNLIQFRVLNELLVAYQAHEGTFTQDVEVMSNQRLAGPTQLTLPAGTTISIKYTNDDGDEVVDSNAFPMDLPGVIDGNILVTPPTGVVGGKASDEKVESLVYARAGPLLRTTEDFLLGFAAPAFFSEIKATVNAGELEFEPVLGHSPDFTWPSHAIYEWLPEKGKYDQINVESQTGNRGPFPGFISVGAEPGDPAAGPQPSSTHRQSPNYPQE